MGAASSTITLTPSVVLASSDGASSTDPGVRSCYRVNASTNACWSSSATTNVVSYTALAENASKSITWITFTAGASGNVITYATPTSAEIGVYNLRLTQTNTIGTSSVVLNSLALTVDCVPTSIANLAITDAERTYALWSAARVEDISKASNAPGT